MCLSNVYENSVEQKNLILSNVQRIDCKDGFVVLVDLFERETRVEGRLATIDLVGHRQHRHHRQGLTMAEYEVVREVQNLCGNNQMRDVFFEEIETDDPVGWVRGLIKGKQVELTVDEKENGDLTVYVVCGGVSQKILMTRL